MPPGSGSLIDIPYHIRSTRIHKIILANVAFACVWTFVMERRDLSMFCCGCRNATQRAKGHLRQPRLEPGDSLQIELLDIPEQSSTFAIGVDGTI